jgi:hypothetical protein
VVFGFPLTLPGAGYQDRVSAAYKPGDPAGYGTPKFLIRRRRLHAYRVGYPPYSSRLADVRKLWQTIPAGIRFAQRATVSVLSRRPPACRPSRLRRLSPAGSGSRGPRPGAAPATGLRASPPSLASSSYRPVRRMLMPRICLSGSWQDADWRDRRARLPIVCGHFPWNPLLSWHYKFRSS